MKVSKLTQIYIIWPNDEVKKYINIRINLGASIVIVVCSLNARRFSDVCRSGANDPLPLCMRARWLHWQPCDVTKNANPVDKSITALQFLRDARAAIKGLLTSTPARIGFWLSRGRDCITRRWCDDVFDSQISWLLCDSACIPVHSESDFKAVWQTLVYTTVEL